MALGGLLVSLRQEIGHLLHYARPIGYPTCLLHYIPLAIEYDDRRDAHNAIPSGSLAA